MSEGEIVDGKIVFIIVVWLVMFSDVENEDLKE